MKKILFFLLFLLSTLTANADYTSIVTFTNPTWSLISSFAVTLTPSPDLTDKIYAPFPDYTIQREFCRLLDGFYLYDTVSYDSGTNNYAFWSGPDWLQYTGDDQAYFSSITCLFNNTGTVGNTYVLTGVTMYQSGITVPVTNNISMSGSSSSTGQILTYPTLTGATEPSFFSGALFYTKTDGIQTYYYSTENTFTFIYLVLLFILFIIIVWQVIAYIFGLGYVSRFFARFK